MQRLSLIQVHKLCVRALANTGECDLRLRAALVFETTRSGGSRRMHDKGFLLCALQVLTARAALPLQIILRQLSGMAASRMDCFVCPVFVKGFVLESAQKRHCRSFTIKLLEL